MKANPKPYFIVLFAFLQIGLIAQASNRGKVIINADLGKDTISRHIYGHFSEHLGRCIYDGFYVGESNTRIPNTKGVRNDVVQALKELKIPNLRWPGGCFADTYHWKDGIGPKAGRPSIVNTWWGNVTEDNSFGTHDFLDMCELLGAEPYLSANVGSGTVQELADWIQYTNHNGKSPMADLRRKNGREQPWNVRYWGVGNETWGCGGNMTAEYYANIYRQYATFMSGWANNGTMVRIASGANSSDYNWTETLMRNIPHNMMEGVALHHYSVIDWSAKSSATQFSEEQYFTTMKRALQMEELVQRHITVMDKYDPRKRVALVVDEWGGWYDVEPGTNPGFLYQQNTMRDAMIAATTLNTFNNHCDRVKMANLAQTINVLQAVILTKEDKMLLTPTYHTMKMYNVHQDAVLLPATLQNCDFALGKEKLPALSASASKDKNGAVHVSLANIDSKEPKIVTLEFRGMAVVSAEAQVLRSPNLQDYNSFESPNKIQPAPLRQVKKSGNTVEVEIPPFSVVVVEVK
ncbi:MAG: alpha-N-arabinofuranosidase [Haliscomenobacter sp.]|nr:alpha-N-arabinofuranosidase [Haliscomenobacter sp.]MBP9078217.1 alpha-N-arabinofuranosidase [Haliscomenobacter sp.]MBP9874457.1 alpha-N-arabinofuranosidase [Haliscomenobacter sp.]